MSAASMDDAEELPGWVPRRQKIWQIGGGLQCSIVGTCLSHDDLARLARKCGLQLAPHLTSYDIHGHFVQEASGDTRLGQAIQKLLDKRHARVISDLENCNGEAARLALWRRELAEGRVAGAYWAFVTDTRIEQTLFNRVFGEVHMLSHMQGRVAHQNLAKLSETHAMIEQLESRLARLSARNRLLATERDEALAAAAEITARQVNLATPKSTMPAFPRRKTGSTIDTRLARKDRALISARERARIAEAALDSATDKIARLELLLAARPVTAVAHCPGAAACETALGEVSARQILYIGGRSGMIEPLRRIAAGANAALMHHDGGLEQSIGRIEPMIERCDAVFCPVDCVSHAACLKAKAICKRLQKPFVPLRSSGAATFERALVGLLA